MSARTQLPSTSAPIQPSVDEHRRNYRRVLDALLSHEHVFYSAPVSPHKLHIPQQKEKLGTFAEAQLPTISSLSLHPVLESLLHILNCDLPSAHFLSRHAEVAPKWESMFVHGVLHRIEGDVDNTRAWYRNVKESDIFRSVWDGDEAGENDHGRPNIAERGWEHFLDRLERYRDRTRRRAGKGGWTDEKDWLDTERVSDWEKEAGMLRQTSLWELKRILSHVEAKFGVDQVLDAKKEFLGRIESGDERLAKIAQSMITGGEGWRIF